MKRLMFLLIGLLLLSGCLEQKKDIFYIENLDTNSFDQNTIVSQTVLLSPTSNITMVDMPADRNEFPGQSGTVQSAARFQLDLNRVSQYRINTFMGSTTATTTRMLLQFSDNNITWYDANIGNEPLCCVLLAGGVGMKTSGWIDANQDLARPGTFFRTILYGGNGSADVSFRNINVQFKVPVSTYATITTGGGGADTNCSTSADCNSLYIQKNPTATQQITGHDLNIFTTSTLPPLTINTTNTTMQRWMLNGTTEIEVCNAFGFSGFCSNTINNPVAFFGFADLSGYLAVSGSGLASALNDDTAWEFQAPLTKVTGSVFQVDNNANIKDLNVINTSNFNKIRVGNDANFLRNAKINNDLYVDKNIYADTYEKDAVLALDTCYINGGKRDMHIYGSITVDVKVDNDGAYVDLQTGVNCGALVSVQQTGISNFGAGTGGIIENSKYAFGFLVHDGNAYQITSTTLGSGSLTLDYTRSYYP